jgi:hypothetical protein
MKAIAFKKFGILLSASLLCFFARGQVFPVTTTDDSGPGSLRDAMADALITGGGTIVFSNVSGTIILESGLPDIDVNLTIVGSGPERVTIDGNQLHRIFHISPGVVCDISGLNMQRGLASTNDPSPVYTRAAIFSEGFLSLSNCFLHDNGPSPGTNAPGPGGGGAIASSGEMLVLNSVTISNNYTRFPSLALGASNVRATNCLFIKNRSDDGAPNGAAGDSIFSNCTFTQNTAWLTGEGGGIAGWGNLTLLDCKISKNIGDHDSGGIYFNGNSLIISNSAIDNNYAGTSISAINAKGNDIEIINSSISGNESFGSYGAMFLNGNVFLNGCTVSSNTTLSFYPGIMLNSGTLTMTNCTISGNRGLSEPGGAISGVGTFQAVNCTIAFNGRGVQTFGSSTFYALNTIIANNGTGATNGDFFGTLTSQGHNLIGRLSTNTIIVGSTNGEIHGVEPLLAPLRNNGRLTSTHALMRGSSAINAGTSIGAPSTDQRGIARPCGTEVDIGAFEYDTLLFTDISRVNSTNIHLQVEGSPNSFCTIQASSNFLDWENVFASGNGTGVWEFVDQDAGNHPKRFYRALTGN